jgi:hypothetical protein
MALPLPGTRAALAGLLSLILTAHSAPVFSAGEREGPALDLGGSIRAFLAATDNYDEPQLFGEGNDVDGLSEAILRLTAEGSDGTGRVGELHLVQDFFYAGSRGAGRSIDLGIASTETRYHAVDLAWRWAEEDDFRATLFFDRLNVQSSSGRADVAFGRQAINFSQAYFWNPLDIFLPFDPEAFDRSYKPGVDALRADYTLGPFSALTLVAAFGRKLVVKPTAEGYALEADDFSDEPWYGSALMARGRTTLHRFDATLQGGKVYGGYQLGAGFSGEAGPLGLRGEGTYFLAAGGSATLLPDAGGERALRRVDLLVDHARFVVGADHRFGSGLYVNGEYFYNGAGEEEDLVLALARVSVGDMTNLGEHLLGLQASYEFHPLLTGHVAWIHSFSDGSDLVTPTFTWSVADEAECLFGATIASGDRPVRGDPGALNCRVNSDPILTPTSSR